MDALEKAAKSLGGISALAREIGEKQQTVSNWKYRHSVPSAHWLKIQEVTGGEVTVSDLWEYSHQKATV